MTEIQSSTVDQLLQYLIAVNGQPQVRTCNNLSIPLPTDSSEEDTNSESEETEEEATMYSK